MKSLTLTISQFNTFVKNILDAEEFLSNIAIIGEVTNLKMSGNNAFFDLKDENAMLSCVKFGAYDLNVKNGDMVTAYGKINFYVKSGRLNFIVGRVTAYGLGDLYQQFLKLKESLEKEGLFREDIKKLIPRFAKRIGVVTSETGAVIRDIINVTRSKNPYTDIIVYPSKVQGVGAENDLVNGVKYFNTRDDIDLIIVARGGGSLEDLAPFNTEKIVRAIYDSNLPVISAVGHETDFTLCDFASDLRVPTPSVAAEVAVFDYFEQLNLIRQITERNSFLINKKVIDYKSKLVLISSSAIDKIKLKLSTNVSKLKSLVESISNKVEFVLKDKSSKLEKLISIISKQNPLEILKNGYSVIELGEKKVISVNDLKKTDKVKIILNDGLVMAEVYEIDKKGVK